MASSTLALPVTRWESDVHTSRNSFLPNKGYTFPNLQLFVMDENGKNVEHIGHLNLGSALHSLFLADGRVMFSR